MNYKYENPTQVEYQRIHQNTDTVNPLVDNLYMCYKNVLESI